MSNQLVPKVTLTEQAQSLAVPSDNVVVLGILGTSERGTANKVERVISQAQAETLFGSNESYGQELVSMIKKAFSEGASIIKAITIGSAATNRNTIDITDELDADITITDTTCTVKDGSKFLPLDDIVIGGETKSIISILGNVITTLAWTAGHLIGDAVTVQNSLNATLTANAEVGATQIYVNDATLYTIGDVIYIGTGVGAYAKEEKRTVLATPALAGDPVTFTEPLTFLHYIGEKAVIVTPKVETDYTTAIASIEEDEDKQIVVTEINSDVMSAAMETMCNNSYNNYKTPCVYFRAPNYGESESTAQASAIAMNSDRALYVYPLLKEYNGKITTAGKMAAATAGLIAGNGIPKLNHNFSVYSSFGDITSKITDMDAMIGAGIVPIELRRQQLRLVRFVTTSTKINGIPDITWREMAIRLNVDEIEKSTVDMLEANYMQVGNTPSIRKAMEKDIIAVLDVFASQEILLEDVTTKTPAYKTPVVTVDPNDSTAVDVELEIAPGKPLNFIKLNFKVYI